MANTALNRTQVLLLTNKSGGGLNQGDVVIIDNANASAFTTTTTSGYIAGTAGVVIEPNGIASNAVGLVAFGGYVPKVNLSGSASLGDFFKTHTVAGQAVRHNPPTQAGDFGMVLGTGTTPAAILWNYLVQSAAAGAPTGYPYLGWGTDATLSAEVDITAMQLVNEIKGWPPIVNTGDLDALSLWWHKVGTPTVAPSVQDVAGAGLTATYKTCIKVQAAAGADGMYQRFTFADEPRVKAGRVVSALVAIWSVSSVSVTAKLLNSDASETAAAAVTTAAWTIVEIPNHTLAGTYVDLQITAGAAGTFYVVPLGLNIGARGLPLKPRGNRYIECSRTTIVNNVDPGGADWANVDVTANSSPLAHKLDLEVYYSNATNVSQRVQVRRNGSADTAGRISNYNSVLNQPIISHIQIPVDDSQIFQYKTGSAGGDNESVSIYLQGWWEWE